MRHAKKQEKKRKITIKKKTVLATLGIIVGVAVIVLGILNFQLIYGFINSRIDALAGRSSAQNSEENKEVADEAEDIEIEDTNTEDNMAEDLPEEELPEATDNKDDSHFFKLLIVS